MMTEDIDKKISMPDVDAEWTRFECEVIGKSPRPNRWAAAAWIGSIAAAFALLFILSNGKEEKAELPVVAEQTKEYPSVAEQKELPLVAELQSENPLPVIKGDENSTIMRLAGTNFKDENLTQPDSNIQKRIANLKIVSSFSSPPDSNTWRLGPIPRLNGKSSDSQASTPLESRIAGLDNPEHRLLSSVRLLGSDPVGELKFIANHIYGEELIKKMHVVTFRASKRHKWMPFYYKEMERLMSPKNLSFGMGCEPSNSNEWILYYDSVAHSLIYKKSGKNIWWSMRRAISKEKKTSDNKTIWLERKKPKKIRGVKVETSSIAITAKQAQNLRTMWTDAVACANNARKGSVMKAYTSDFWRYEFPFGDLRNKMSYIYTGLNPFTKFTNDLAEAVRTENTSLTDSLLADTTLRKCLYDMKEYMKPVHLIEDSLVLVVNKQVQPDSLCKLISKRPKQYFHQKGLIVKTTSMWTAYGAKFASGYDKNCPIMELTTLPDTLSDTYVDLHPEMKDTLRHISGIILDENEKPLVDAWVSISGNTGSPTDSTGRFSFWAPRSATSLRAECTGYTGYKKTNIGLSDTTLVIHLEDRTKIKPVKVLPKEQIREIQGLPGDTKSDSIKR